MQFHGELDMQAGYGAAVAPSSRKRPSAVSRKMTVRLTESLCERLEAATERPGVGKSMVVAAALERFLDPAASVDDQIAERLDELNTRFDRFEHNMRMMAETVALHARYHRAVMPPVPDSRQREAVLLGDERFRILAEQVDRRVRQCRPLMQETIDRVNSRDFASSERPATEVAPQDPEPGPNQQEPAAQAVEVDHASSTARRRDAAAYGMAGPQPAGPDCDLQSTGEVAVSQGRPLSKWRLILSVFMPFAAGYYLAYLFRTINAAITPALTSDFGLDPAQTGLLASVYFLVFGFAQIPIGFLLDRCGPRRVQGVLLIIAAGGATLFGNASSFPELLVARAMIGLGVAGSLMAGLKTIVTWFPRERVALANGWMIMLGSLGALTATAPADWLLELMGWRSLFEVLTLATVVVAALIYVISPEHSKAAEIIPERKPLTLWSVFSDPRFLRMAPLSAACIGSSWALQSLWAAAWLTDVEGYARQGRVTHLFFMAVALSLGALLLGAAADRLRKRNIKTEIVLASVAALFVLAQLALVLRVPIPSFVPWSVVSIAGAATVLSFTVIAEYFPNAFAARANGALNLLHFGWAFVVQSGIGFVVGQWPPHEGRYPLAAYQTAFGLCVLLQAITLLWFAIPWLRSITRRFDELLTRRTVECDAEVGLIALPAEGAILEAHQSMEW